MVSLEIAFSDLAENSNSVIDELLDQSSYMPLRFLARDPTPGLVEFWSKSIDALLRGGDATGLLASGGGRALGLIVYSGNPWETAVLGEKAGVINHFVVSRSRGLELAASLLDKVIVMAASDGLRLLSAKAYTDDVTTIHALESRGFLLMDTVVDCYYDYRRFRLDTVPAPVLSADVTLRPAIESDRGALLDTARLAFGGHFGRFHSDEKIGKTVATGLYEKWLNDSMDGYADWIDVAEVSGTIAGFSTWKRPSPLENRLPARVSHYSISGIHPEHHGRGLFTALTHQGMKHLEGTAEIIEGPTHINNRGVQAGYSKLRWSVCADARHSFHKWLPPPGGFPPTQA